MQPFDGSDVYFMLNVSPSQTLRLGFLMSFEIEMEPGFLQGFYSQVSGFLRSPSHVSNASETRAVRAHLLCQEALRPHEGGSRRSYSWPGPGFIGEEAKQRVRELS